MIQRFSVCLVATFLLVSPATAQPITLVEAGAPKVGLVLPGNPEAEETLAAEELCRFIEKMSGAAIPTVQADAEGTKIYLGRAEAFPSLPVASEAADLEPEEYLIEGKDGDLCLLGGSARGALWAVYDLLGELGCRWYMPGDVGEVVPKRESLQVEGKLRVDGPDFPYRQVWYSWGGPAPDCGPRLGVWARRNRLAHPLVMHGHNLTNSLPPDASFEKRPDLYALVGGKRQKSQVCTTDPETIRLITQTVIDYFDKNPQALCYSLCPDDNEGFCECDRCLVLDTGEIDKTREKRIVTDRYVTFLNQVAEGIQKKHPGKMVSMYAYVCHSTPPVRTEVSPYVVVFFTASVYCGGHGIGDPHCQSRMEMKTDLEAWTKACKNVYIYEYDPVPGNAELPWPLFGARTREMPLYREMGIRGISMESHCSWATLSPNHWFTAQCLWDADHTEGDLLEDYCKGFFHLEGDPDAGKVFDNMRQFYVTIEKSLAEYGPKIEWGQRDVPDIFPMATVRRCRACLDKALDIAKGSSSPEKDAVLERLQMVDLGFRYFENYLTCRRIMGEGGEYKAFREAFEACESLLDEMTGTNTDYVETHSSGPGLKSGLGVSMGMRFPEELGLVTAWNAVGPFDNAGYAGHDRVYAPEKERDLSATYDGLESPVEWKRISGMGYVDLAGQFTPKDWATVYALDYIHTDRDVDAQLRLGSNDTVKVWLGNELVWRYDEGRTAVLDDDIVDVHLGAGVTPVLLKVSQSGGDWGFYFRITDRNGDPIPDVRVETAP